MVKFAVTLACLILTGLSVFQLLLVFGFPFGHYAWGGQHKLLPTRLRIASIIAILLYILFALIMLDKGGLLTVFPSRNIARVGIWVLTVYFFIGTAMQAISQSNPEKYTMTPIACILAIITPVNMKSP